MFSICKQLSSCIVGQAGVCRQHTLTRRRDNSTDCVLDSRKAGRMDRQSDTYEPLFTADWTASHCQLLLLFCCFAHGPPSPQFHSTRQNITLIRCKRTVLNSACGNRQSVRWRDDCLEVCWFHLPSIQQLYWFSNDDLGWVQQIHQSKSQVIPLTGISSLTTNSWKVSSLPPIKRLPVIIHVTWIGWHTSDGPVR